MPSPLKQPWLLIWLVCNSVSIDYNEGRIKSGAMVINYCWSSVESPVETWKGGGGWVDTWGATQAGTKACHEGPRLPLLETNTLQIEVRTT